MSYESRLDRLELAKASVPATCSREALIRLAGITHAEAREMTVWALHDVARRRIGGEPWVTFTRDLEVDSVRMPTKTGWRRATISEFSFWRDLCARVKDEV
jgi:hypothetical protein